MTPKTALLQVVEKFRAPAALYQPSKNAGDGWIEISGIGKGGEAIIQVQEDVKCKDELIPVVRFQFRHGKDFLNARIIRGLPIERKGPLGFVFKSSSSNSGGYDIKTVSCIKFKCKDDADDFMMWWLAKNGSLEALFNADDQKKKARKVLGDSTNRLALKRKAEEISDGSHRVLEPFLKRMCKETEKDTNENVANHLKLSYDTNIDREPDIEAKSRGPPSLNGKCTETCEANDADDVKDSSGESDSATAGEENLIDENGSKDDGEVEVFIHGGYGAHSQDWTTAFLLD